MTGDSVTTTRHGAGGVIDNDHDHDHSYHDDDVPGNQHRESDEETPLLGGTNGSSGFNTVGNGVANGNGAGKNDDDEADGRVKGKKLFAILCALWLGTFLSALDQTLLTTLLAPISSTFSSFDNISWVATGYLIATAALQPLFGRLTDIFGRKNGLLVCNLLFGVGTLWCGLSGNVWQMVFGRVIAGMGGGGLTTIAVMTISDLVPLRERGVIQGVSNIIFGTGSGLGGLFGGFINDTLGWRWAFILQIPFIIISTLIVLRFLSLPPPKTSISPASPASPASPSEQNDQQENTIIPPIQQLPKSSFERIDYAGSFTLITSLTLLLLGLNSGGNVIPWSHPLLISSLVLAVVFLGAFVYVEENVAKEPIIPLGLLKVRTIVAACLQNWFMVMAVYSVLFYLPIFHLLLSTGTSTTLSGLLLSPFAIGLSLGSLISGLTMKRTGKYYILSLLLALLLATTSLTFLTIYDPISVPSPTPSFLIQNLNLAAFGFAYGGTLTVTLLALISAVPHSHQAVVTSASYLFRATGSTIGVALSGAVFQNILRRELVRRLSGRGGAQGEADAVIERVLRSFEEVAGLAPEWKGEIVAAFAAALRGVWALVFVFAAAGVVCAVVLRENRLHSRLDRK
ncbi:major facilitator superfamily domain-containing protein [Peziza echinospora]|nr:major facilitator superfamily domain-containing protein [Peziza echinospora]